MTISAGVLSDPHVNGTWGPRPRLASYSHSQCVSQEWYRNMNSGKLIATRFGLFYYDVWDPEPTNEHSSHAISYSGSENGTNIFMQWTSPSVFYWRHLDYWWN